ncbi:hypothetical protein NFI96_001152 [Prochilodus magdalenae]|nr:hypothetical protein NFI96_001152 [Prochilodus magdalenae]
MVKAREWSQKTREEVIALHKNGNGYKKIAKLLNIPRDTIESIIRKFKLKGTVETLPGRGRKKILTATAVRYLKRNVEKNPRVTAKELKKDLSDVGTEVSAQTIRRALHNEDLHARTPRRTPLLTPKNKKSRLQYAKSHVDKPQRFLCPNFFGILFVVDDTSYLPEMRILQLGCRYAGKSSAGNTILNREEFELKRTVQCVKRQGEVAGRHITVVEAPGWWSNEPVEESTELLKQEIVLSVSLCPPGPHAVLLIIRVDWVFDRNDRSILEGYLNLLTDTVWSHTIVLFTCGDCLGGTPIEQHIESEGKELQWLVEKCGNRYHVLNNKNRSDYTQVTELLEKIEEMVAANNGWHFEIDKKILQEVEEKRRAEETREKESHKQKNRGSWMGCRLENENLNHFFSIYCSGERMDLWGRFGLENRPSSASSYMSMKKDYSAVSPDPSEVSIKWVWSMDNPGNFSGPLPYDHQRFGLENRPSSASSYMSMKKNYSAVSQCPSEVSMKTDWSMNNPGNFSGSFPYDHQRFGLENRPTSASSYMSMKTEYSAASPVPSEVSIQTDWSMNNPENFSGSLPYDRQRCGLENRPTSASSYMSMKTEYSAASPVPSEVSIKMDWSMDKPGNFSGSLPYDHQRLRIKIVSPAAVFPSYVEPGDTACTGSMLKVMFL